MSEGPKFACDGCNRRYSWKPELAARKVRCKCGQVLTVPDDVSAEADPLYEMEQLAAPAATPAGVIACPSCSAAIAPEAVLCVQCGYNMKTGQRLGTQVAAGAAGAAAVPGAAPASAKPKRGNKPAGRAEPRSRSAEVEENGGNIRRIALAGGGLVLLIGLLVGARFYMKGSTQPAGPMLGEDATALRMLKEEAPIEAKEFLDANNVRMLGNTWTRSQAYHRIEQWYKMGAKKVWAFTAIMSLHVVIELPEAAEQRKELFDWAKRWDEEHMREPAKDVGQKYLIINVM